ncbi:hypothetical protein ACH5RR_032629 [Cinchona calisaya]|uniref:Uncharacterized protein n=1 Tax=Cinchona calisaya TaxID=153742 RepID=A0ABD2YLS3_9GENT
MELGENQLQGSIPISIGNLSNLEKLFLGKNQLSGSIPQDIGKLKKFAISGPLPELLCQSGTLEIITVTENMLTGPILRSLKTCSSLVRARFNGSHLRGNLSEMFGIYEFLDLMIVCLVRDFSGWKKYSMSGRLHKMDNSTIEEATTLEMKDVLESSSRKEQVSTESMEVPKAQTNLTGRSETSTLSMMEEDSQIPISKLFC